MHFSYLLHCSIRSSCQYKLKNSKLKSLSSLPICFLFPFGYPTCSQWNQVNFLFHSIHSHPIWISPLHLQPILPSTSFILFYHIWVLFSKTVSVSSLQTERFKLLSFPCKTVHRLTLAYPSTLLLRQTERITLTQSILQGLYTYLCPKSPSV